MKKLLLLSTAALLSASSYADTWALVGAQTNWGYNQGMTFQGEGNELSLEVAELKNDFKIVPLNENGGLNWDYLYSTDTPIEINKEYELTARDGGDDLANMTFDGLIQTVKNATLKWNPSTAIFEVVANQSDVVEALPTLYVTGSFCSWTDPGKDGSVLMTENNGIYTAQVNLGTSGNVEFKLAGEGWSNEIAGAFAGIEITANEATLVQKGGSNLTTTLTGNQTITFNYNTMGMTFGEESLTLNPVTPRPSADWIIVGAYSDWKFENSVHFEGEGDNLSCTVENLTTGFKIVDMALNNWDIEYGSGDPIMPNVELELTLHGSNVEFGGLVQEIHNAVVSWNPTTHVVKITATESDIVTGLPTLYVTGSFCEWNTPGEGGSVLMSQENGIYTANINLGDSGNVEFKLAGAGWSNEIAGAFGGIEITATQATKVQNGGENLVTKLTGQQTLTFNYNTMGLTFGAEELTLNPVTPQEPGEDEPGEDEPTEAQWAIVGAYCDWKFENAITLTGEGDVLSATIEYLTNDFKIVDLNIGWDSQMGTATQIEPGETYELEGKVDGVDVPNMTFAGLILGINNATVEWNPKTSELTISAEDNDIVIGLPTLYVTGSFCEWVGPGEQGTVLMSQKEGIYTADLYFTEDMLNENGVIEFKVAGENWANEIAGGVMVLNEPVKVTKGGANLFTDLIGNVTLTLDYEGMTIYFVGGTSGVDSIDFENSEAPVFYNLQGVKIQNPDKGIYIIKKGNKTSKVIF